MAQEIDEVAAAIEQAREHPAMGVTIQKVSPDKPYVGFWYGSNGQRSYVRKIVFSTGSVQGAATTEAFDAVGYKSIDEAAADLAVLGYTGSYMQFAPYAGQLRLF